jgi:hypothetical protein
MGDQREFCDMNLQGGVRLVPTDLPQFFGPALAWDPTTWKGVYRA